MMTSAAADYPNRPVRVVVASAPEFNKCGVQLHLKRRTYSSSRMSGNWFDLNK
jgi:hypothetical protein